MNISDAARESHIFAHGLCGLAQCMAFSPSMIEPDMLQAFFLGMNKLTDDLQGLEQMVEELAAKARTF